MKRVLIFIFAFLIGSLSILSWGILRRNPGKPIQNIIETVTKPNFSIAEAPSNSIRGTVSKMSGDIFWESRTATQSSEVNSPINFTLQPGEEIQTGNDGYITMDFPNEAEIEARPKTQIDFVQTLPVNFVASIASGSAQIKELSQVPVTIRVMHLLLKEVNANMEINLDSEKSITNINVISGSVTAAYNDLNLNSHETTFTEGQKPVFDDLTRTFSF